jgi:glycosyltransferase involved in cell wall biosynthesis
MKKYPTLSVVVLTKNAQDLISECLDSAKFADDLLIIDSGSTDKTIEIVKSKKARIINFPGQKIEFAKWRNQGLKEARGDWLLYLDSDERITPSLQKEIISTIAHPTTVAYEIPRQNYYLGQPVRFGGAWPDYVKRLFRKDKLRGWENELHENPIVVGSFGRLKSPLLHFTHRDLSSMMEKTKEWSKIEARLLYEANHPPVTWWRILRPMVSEFWQRGIIKQGLRDGAVGWIEVIFQVFSRFITYARLWELQWQAKNKKQS